MGKRKFIIGEEWIYYKIYCGLYVADKLLIRMLRPLIKELRRKKLLETWFYIRYKDNDPHLRIRFKMRDKDDVGLIILICQGYFRPYLDHGSIWKVTIDTYDREIERYGNHTIELIEKVFNYDSELAINLVCLHKGDEERFWLTMNYFERILDLFKLKKVEKLKLVRKHLIHNSALKNSNFVKFDIEVEKFFYHRLEFREDNSRMDLFPEAQILLNAFSSWNNSIKYLAHELVRRSASDQLQIPLLELLESIIHMFFNRIFIDGQRNYEFLGYYLMNSVLSSKIKEK